MDQMIAESQPMSMERNIDEMYHNSLDWQSEVSLWKQELKFFQKMLDTYTRKCLSVQQKQRLSHLQNLLIYYNGELLDQFKQQTRRHVKYLSHQMEEESSLNLNEYQQKFGGLSNHLAAFATEYRRYKKDFFTLMSELIDQSSEKEALAEPIGTD
ncbi:hypothetical protein [Tunicatimonas pelagia]|uniref:hypothetical protein n=1 Tax=Tunicatimonas pelagia TaxID=931531 RepID=UPI002665026E|nr:hypothetical protein [Tunicatimonas pelagia]WKN41667.1 hypothetical protein P0M28_21760 [Tunicatimonas pelagia]